LARDFIDALTKGFDPVKYHDEYRERLAALIQAKAEGQTVTLPAAPAAPAKVVNLMEARSASRSSKSKGRRRRRTWLARRPLNRSVKRSRRGRRVAVVGGWPRFLEAPKLS
jgi:non-homologous end joining protein Ku